MTLKWWQGNVGYWGSTDTYPNLTPNESMQRMLLNMHVPLWVGILGARLIQDGGGNHLCMPPIEEDYEKIIARGKVWKIGENAKFKMMRGRPSKCHANAAALWEGNAASNAPCIGPERWKICTGYALTAGDQMWRQHTWCLWKRPRAGETIIETTTPRSVYFGFELTDDEARQFAEENYL